MIYIIGTCHKTQVWNRLVKKQPLGIVPLAKIAAFQEFVTEAANSLGAAAIAEEMNEERMLVYGHNAMSVAQLVARHLKIAHVFCEPNRDERLALGLRAGREMDQHVAEIVTRTGRDFVQVQKFGNNSRCVRPSGLRASRHTTCKQTRWCSYAGPTIAKPSRKL